MPKISIILPCYNAAIYLEAALKSIFAQSFTDFELIAINDGSNDDTRNILMSYQQTEKKLKIIHHHQQLGIATSLNRGIEVAKGLYIGRMDADDISLPQRLQCQINYLIEHPEIDIIGSRTLGINNKGYHLFKSPNLATTQAAIHFISFFTAPLSHPSVLGKTEIFKRNFYSDAFRHNFIEDYELWHRMISNGVRCTNLLKTLLHYRVHISSTSKKSASIQQNNAAYFLKNTLKRELDIKISIEEANWLRHRTSGDLKKTNNLFKTIFQKFEANRLISAKAKNEIETFIILSLCELSLKNLRHHFSINHFIESLHIAIKFKISRRFFIKRAKVFLLNHWRGLS